MTDQLSFGTRVFPIDICCPSCHNYSRVIMQIKASYKDKSKEYESKVIEHFRCAFCNEELESITYITVRKRDKYIRPY